MSTGNDKSKGKPSPSNDDGKEKMEIEITRYKRLVETFNHPRALAKLIVVVSMIIVLVFFGISIIALVIKSYYPFKAVNSNEYGATIIKNEDNEVIYWLFNTADLWANSGIHVKEGDVISVRASGAFHSSIHHLVDDAKKNKKGRKWVKPAGGPNLTPPTPREETRSAYRISPEQRENILLMQVIPENMELKDGDGNWSIENAYYLDGRNHEVKNNNNTIDHKKSIYPDIYVIGADREKITIRSNGVLHFAVNDIALTRNNIMKMKGEVVFNTSLHKDTSLLKLGPFPIPDVSNYGIFKNDSIGFKKGQAALMDTHDKYRFCDNSEENNIYNDNYKNRYDTLFKKIDSIYENKYVVIKQYKPSPKDSLFFKDKYTELDYYLIRNFVDAWFVDNVGSYLIVIEREKQ